MKQLLKKWDCILLFVILAALYVWQGGYFSNGYSVILLLLFGFTALNYKRVSGRGEFIVISFIMVVICFLTSLFADNSIHIPIMELPKYVAFIPLLMIFSNQLYRKTGYFVIITISILTAMAGILACIGALNVLNWALQSGRGMRLQGFLQYANTAAVLIGAALFLLYQYQCENEGKGRLKHVLMAVLSVALFLTESIGALLCIAAAYVVCFFLCRKSEKIIPLGAILLTGGITGIIYVFLSGYGTVCRLLWIAVSIFLVYMTSVLADRHSPHIELKHKKLYLVIFCAVFAGIGLFSITKSATFFERIISDIDAVALIKKHPFGIGVGNWSFIQDTVKSIGYTMKYIHCGYLQMYLDGGPAAFVLFAGMICISVYRSIKNGMNNRAIPDCRSAILLFMALHMLVDVDLNFVIFIALLAIIQSEFDREVTNKYIASLISAVCVIGGIFTSVYSLYDYALSQKEEMYEASYDFTRAEQTIDQKLKFQKADVNSIAVKSRIIELDESRISEAYDLLLEAGRKSPENAAINIERYNFEKRNGMPYEDKIKRLKEILSSYKANTDLHSELLQTYIYGLKNSIISPEEFLTECGAAYSEIENINSKNGILRFYNGVPMNVDITVLTEAHDLLNMSEEQLNQIASENKENQDNISDIVSQMSLEDKARMLILCPLDTVQGNERYGGILLGSRNVTSPEMLRSEIEKIRNVNNVSILAVMEQGSQSSTIRERQLFNLPDYSCRDYFKNYEYDDRAYALGSEIGEVLNKYGIEMCLGLQAEAVQNKNAYLWDITFAFSTEEANDIVKKYISGMQSHGVHTVVEQFPAYANNSENPQEAVMLADFNYTRRVSNIYPPVRAAIERNAACIMMSHLLVPNSMTSVINAEFSKYYTTKILRNELNFHNVILTDILTSKAALSNVTNKQAVLYAINAGCDMLYVTEQPEQTARYVIENVKDGKISEERLDKSVKRILALKYNIY